MSGTDVIRVRAFCAGDADSVAGLCAQLGYPATAAEVEQRLRHAGENGHTGNASHAIFVAESQDGRAVGWVEVRVRTILVVERHAEVEGLVVDRDWRGKGVGRALMKRAEDWARQAGCEVVSLRSNVVREGARPFYESIGYEVAKTQWSFSKRLT